MTRASYPSSSTRCRLLIGMAGCGLTGSLQRHEMVGKETIPEAEQMMLWNIVDAVGKEMPRSKERVEAVLKTRLTDQTRDEYLWHLVGAGQPLDEGLSITRISLALKPTGEFGKNSGLSIELGGRCVKLDEIRSRFGALTVVQHPRGRSLQETTVYAATMPWGELSFAFKEESRNCLFRISFRKQMP